MSYINDLMTSCLITTRQTSMCRSIS